MGARIAAALLAAGLVVGAIVVRDRMDAPPENQPRVERTTCSPEFASACSETNDDAAMVDELIAVESRRNSPITQWVTAGPLPQMVDEARRAGSRPKLFTSTKTVASTELVAVIRTMPQQCAGKPVTWRCLGEAAGATAAGAARPALAGPSRSSSTRLLLRAALVGGFLESTNYASNDIDLSPGAADYISAAERGIEAGRARGATTLADFSVVPAADVFITTRADARAAAPGLQVLEPAPKVRVDAIVGAVGEEGDSEAFASELRRAGWGAPNRTADDGLPSPGVLLALRGLG